MFCMSLSRVYSRAGVGVTAPEVTVEVHVGGGLPKVSLVGLPATAVRESKDRVKAALLNAGFRFPPAHVTISLAPADLPKEGSRFDLPIALGILAASAQVSDERFGAFEFLGELSLSGGVNPVRGVLPAAIAAAAADRGLVVPEANGTEAALAKGSRHYSAASLLAVVSWLQGRDPLPALVAPPSRAEMPGRDLADVQGQHRARRALEIAAAGGHNLLLSGPPGTGKTMLASRLPGILPPLGEDEALATAAVASVSQAGLDISRWNIRSFRAPHHTASSAALVGGGSKPKPGEISLAHHGVLFLDELPEFRRDVLEVLREPLESGRVIICRAASHSEFPARFQLVAAMNPCPCGYAGDRSGRCMCSFEQIQKYRGKISGPLLDRIDLHVEVSRPTWSVAAHGSTPPENSATVRRRVVAARERQLKRAGVPNSAMDNTLVQRDCRLERKNRRFLEQAVEQMALSPRACQRILKVARTVADLEGADRVAQEHVAEAIAFRGMDCGNNQG
jgi:magnesium chelatase family protein